MTDKGQLSGKKLSFMLSKRQDLSFNKGLNPKNID
jgi:hypothetical protein